MICTRLLKSITWYMIAAMFVIGIAPRVDAGLSPSELIVQQKIERSADMQSVMKVIETKMVKERLEVLGFTAEETQSRLDQLSDEQLHSLASSLDDLKVGGDGLGVVIALLVIAILIVILLQLTGHKVIVR